MNRFLRAALALVLSLLVLAPAGAQAMASLPLTSGDAASSFEAWMDQSASRRAEVAAFETFLTQQRVVGVLPTREILLTDTDWSQCRSISPYALPERAQWTHIVNTLRYVRDEIVPRIGAVQVISGYRDKKLNRCVDGAKHSAHAQFYAFDLMPVRKLERSELITQVCTSHARVGASYNAGLGIYDGTKFHIDTRSFRRWGPDYRSTSSPCMRYEASLRRKGKSFAVTKAGKKSRAKIQFAVTSIPRLRLAMMVD